MATQTGPKIPVFVGASDGDTYTPPMNRGWRMLQALVEGNVIDNNDTPPVSPANGDTYIVAPSAIGAWAGHDNSIAYWTTQDLENPGGIWEFYVPKDGWTVAVTGTFGEAAEVWRFNGTDWTVATMIGSTGTGLFTGAGTAVTITLAPGFDNTNYMIDVSYDHPVVNPGFLSVEYVDGTHFKVHSSSATDASPFRYATIG